MVKPIITTQKNCAESQMVRMSCCLQNCYAGIMSERFKKKIIIKENVAAKKEQVMWECGLILTIYCKDRQGG